MTKTEYTEREIQLGEDATVLDREFDNGDLSVTIRGIGTAPQQNPAMGAAEDGLTVCAGHARSERVSDETFGGAPVYKVSRRGPSLKRLLTGEEILISKSVFCIGRKDDVDYSVAMNAAISRKHAEIITRNGRYYIRDLGAKNRTYVNGKVLPMKEERNLSDGDVIKLANEDFLFSCEGV